MGVVVFEPCNVGLSLRPSLKCPDLFIYSGLHTNSEIVVKAVLCGINVPRVLLQPGNGFIRIFFISIAHLV